MHAVPRRCVTQRLLPSAVSCLDWRWRCYARMHLWQLASQLQMRGRCLVRLQVPDVLQSLFFLPTAAGLQQLMRVSRPPGLSPKGSLSCCCCCLDCRQRPCTISWQGTAASLQTPLPLPATAVAAAAAAAAVAAAAAAVVVAALPAATPRPPSSSSSSSSNHHRCWLPRPSTRLCCGRCRAWTRCCSSRS
jgi:hypothetical protein